MQTPRKSWYVNCTELGTRSVYHLTVFVSAQDANGDGKITAEEFQDWYSRSLLFQQYKGEVETGGEDEQ
eukprot:SAG31_NODE_41190_length_277_cov_0.837079_1_plen_68_part_01